MKHSRWNVHTTDGQVTVCRQLPARFDVSATTTLPKGRALRYAHQIRQDMWRALQNVRGFSPVVRLATTDSGWQVTAGGRISGRKTASLVQQIETVLDNPANRHRWITHANRKSKVST